MWPAPHTQPPTSIASYQAPQVHGAHTPTHTLPQQAKDDYLLNYLLDNQNAWEVQPDGTYAKCSPAEGEAPFSAQLSLLEDLYA